MRIDDGNTDERARIGTEIRLYPAAVVLELNGSRSTISAASPRCGS